MELRVLVRVLDLRRGRREIDLVAAVLHGMGLRSEKNIPRYQLHVLVSEPDQRCDSGVVGVSDGRVWVMGKGEVTDVGDLGEVFEESTVGARHVVSHALWGGGGVSIETGSVGGEGWGGGEERLTCKKLKLAEALSGSPVAEC